MTTGRSSQKSEIKRQWPYLAITILFLLIYLFYNHLFQMADMNYISLGDNCRHLGIVYDAYHRAAPSGFPAPPSLYYPPLVYQVTFLFFRLSGVSIASALASQGIFIFILGISIYFIGARLFGPQAGILSVVAALTVPFVALISRQYLLDVPLLAAVAVALAFLIYSDSFRSPLYTWLFFAACALGIMTKATFPVFVIVPAGMALCGFIRRQRKKLPPEQFHKGMLSFLIPVIGILTGWLLARTGVVMETPGPFPWSRYLVSLLPVVIAAAGLYLLKPPSGFCWLGAGVLLGAFLCWHYYGIYLESILSNTAILGAGGHQVRDPIHYLVILFDGALSYPLAGMAVAGVVAVIIRKQNDAYPLVWGFLFCILFFYLFPVKDERYYIPMAALAAPLAGGWAAGFQLRWARTAAVTFLLFTGFSGWLCWTFAGDNLLYRITPKPSGSFLIDYRSVVWGPYTSGFGSGSLADCAALASRREPMLLVTTSRGVPGGGIPDVEVPVQLRYRHNIVLYPTRIVDGCNWSHRENHTNGPDQFTFFVNTPDRGETDTSRIKYIMILNTNDGRNLEPYPPVLRRDLIKTGLPTRPDLLTNLGPGPAISKSKVRWVTQLTRISLGNEISRKGLKKPDRKLPKYPEHPDTQ